MRSAILGAVIGATLVLAAEYLFLTEGGMPVATRGGPLPLERFLTGRALRRAVAADAARASPVPADEPNLLAGARVYRTYCQGCHGAPDDRAPSAIAGGMFPPPPLLLAPGKGVTDDPVGESYWKVKHGIRLTGMPGFEGALTEVELWQVSQLVAGADKLPGPVRAALR